MQSEMVLVMGLASPRPPRSMTDEVPSPPRAHTTRELSPARLKYESVTLSSPMRLSVADRA
jgi:hypothetical protein